MTETAGRLEIGMALPESTLFEPVPAPTCACGLTVPGAWTGLGVHHTSRVCARVVSMARRVA